MQEVMASDNTGHPCIVSPSLVVTRHCPFGTFSTLGRVLL